MSFEDDLRQEFFADRRAGDARRRIGKRGQAAGSPTDKPDPSGLGAGAFLVVAAFGALAILPRDSTPETIETVDGSPTDGSTLDNTLVVETTVVPDEPESSSDEAPDGNPTGEDAERPDDDASSLEQDDPSQQDDPAEQADPSQQDGPSDSDSPSDPVGLVTESDLRYLGAFRVPADVGDPGFEYGGRAAAHNPFGDPESSDGFDGSLFLTGFSRNELVAEISIPAPLLHDGTPAGLPIADVLQPIADVTGGRASEFIGSKDRGGLDDFRIGGLEVVVGPTGPRLHWTAWQYFNVGYNDVAGHGHSSLNLSNPDPQGPWYLGDFKTYATAGYLFSVPEAFADQQLAGRSLLAGFQAGPPTATTSWGPPFFAFDPPAAAEPETRIDAIELASYPFPDSRLTGYEEASLTPGADWVSTSDGRRAIVTVGNGRTLESSCNRDDGSDRQAFNPRFSFYDPADLAAVARGQLDPSAIEPHRTWSPAEHLIPTCGLQLSSISFDEATGRLYVIQVLADTSQRQLEPLPVVHVFELS